MSTEELIAQLFSDLNQLRSECSRHSVKARRLETLVAEECCGIDLVKLWGNQADGALRLHTLVLTAYFGFQRFAISYREGQVGEVLFRNETIAALQFVSQVADGFCDVRTNCYKDADLMGQVYRQQRRQYGRSTPAK